MARQGLSSHLEPLKAITTASWLYPLKGIFYFLTHLYLWPLLRARLLPCFLLSTFVLFNLFIWTYLPQVALLAVFHGTTGAWINGTILVLGEGAAIVAVLLEAFFLDETLVDIFDATLVAHGCEELVEVFRPVASADSTPAAGSQDSSGQPPTAVGPGTSNGSEQNELNPLQRLGAPTQSSEYSPFSFVQISEFVMLLPLNIIPWVGTPLFLLLTGYRAGPLHHYRYFKMRGFNRKERRRWKKQRKGKYTLFGTVCLALQLIPVLDLLFIMTNAVGSALWAVELEKERQAVLARAQPGTQPAHHDGDDPPPPYTDDPV